MKVHVTLIATLALVLSGCLGDGGILQDDPVEPQANETLEEITEVQDRHEMEFVIDDGWSKTLENGTYEILDGIGVHVSVDLPATEGASAAAGQAAVHLGLFLPDIPGCDWEAGNLSSACQVPVVADVGPYYSASGAMTPQLEGDSIATEPANRLGGFLIEQLVPHGYAVAQVSVFGTGDSNHCMDLMGDSEQAGIHGAVEWLGSQAWSNGNVGLIGRSYDGTTPWEAAAMGSEHLKTIVPISGLIGLHDLMWRNGSAENRGGTGLLYALYYTFAFDGDPGDAEHVLCPDALQGAPQNWAAYATGDQVAPAVNPYWAERSGFLERALENYDGSVYLIHGLQDWNVDPHMVVPAHRILEDAGFEVKGLYGQWDHAYPDRVSDHEDQGPGYGEEAFPATVRHDWAQDLLEWFDHYLKGEGEQPQLHSEVQDQFGHWRLEESYPPRDRIPIELTLDEATLDADAENAVTPETGLTLTFGPISHTQDTILTGSHHLHVQVTPGGPGGQLFAELRDADTGLRMGHAVMDLRYHDGGDQMQPITPGMPITAKMEFLAFEGVLPAGHGLELEIQQTGMDYMAPAVNTPVVVDTGDASVLRLFTVERTLEDFFTPPGPEQSLPDYVLGPSE